MNWPFVRRNFLTEALAAYDSQREESQCLRTQIMTASELFSAKEQRLTDASLAANARALSAEGRYDALAERFDKLLAQFAELRLAGAFVPEPVVALERKPVGALDQALSAASHGKPPALIAAMRRQLREDRKAIEAGFTSEADVLLSIQQGISGDGVPV